eukprot:TRINITY_DN14080_c0_g1_i1.p1 TRINITY_DN14080_c0_g1~~TRINITY_DN14080_c0_g1_i1.p1  ORF type:complete len:146 (+),score=3.56 TRINITY_DN14080_c0_g1_i1:99-536(+)
MDLPAEMWKHIIDYAIHSYREDYETRFREWEAQARQVDENTPADLLKKLIVINPSDDQIIIKDKVPPENVIVSFKRINKQLCQLVHGTEAWWRRIFRSFYNSDNWFNISRLTSYQEALNMLKKVSTSAKQVKKILIAAASLAFSI